MARRLDGIRVLDIGLNTAGPYAARLLGDLGADVIKVEPVEGEGTRALGMRFGDTGYLFHNNNFNKRSVTLQVQHPRGREIFLDLVARSDVVIENFAIGTMDKWGIGYAACCEVNPAIVFCSVKGFGESGPLRNLRAFDTVTQALSGMMDATGAPGLPPLKAGPSVCDILGGIVSAMAVAAALAGRKPGQAQFIDTALFDVGAFSLIPLWPLARNGREYVQSLGNAHPLHAPFGHFRCSDGLLMVTVTRDAHWRSLARWLDLDPAWTRALRKDHEDHINAALAARIEPLTADEAALLLQSFGAPAAPVLDLAQVAGSAQVAARRMIGDVDHPVFGKVPLIKPALATGHSDRGPWRLQPVLGEGNDELIGALLGREGELGALRDEGVIR